MKFIVKAGGQGEYSWEGLAVFALDNASVSELLNQRELFQMVRNKDEQLLSLEYAGNPALFFEDGILVLDHFLTEVEKTVLEHDRILRVPDARVLPGYDQDGCEGTYVDCTYIAGEGFYFRSGLDSVDQYATTEPIPWKELLKK